jgi:hypothetical protein
MKARRRRRKNAALEELARISGADLGGGGGGGGGALTMGRRLLRSLGYRSRLGMVFIPIVGGGGATVIDEINDAGGWH